MKKFLLVCCLFIGLTSASRSQSSHPATVDPAQKAKELQKKLKLTDAQTVKIAAIYKESAKKFNDIKAAEHGNTNKMLVAIRPLRAATINKIKAVLKPAQAIAYDKLVSEKGNTGGNGWSDGWSPTTSRS